LAQKRPLPFMLEEGGNRDLMPQKGKHIPTRKSKKGEGGIRLWAIFCAAGVLSIANKLGGKMGKRAEGPRERQKTSEPSKTGPTQKVALGPEGSGRKKH